MSTRSNNKCTARSITAATPFTLQHYVTPRAFCPIRACVRALTPLQLPPLLSSTDMVEGHQRLPTAKFKLE